MTFSSKLSVPALVALSVVGLALAGGLLGAVAVEPLVESLFFANGFDGYSPAPAVVRQKTVVVVVCTVISTTVLLGLALLVSLRKSEKVERRTFLACALLGWLNCPIALSTAEAVAGESHASEMFLAGLCFGLFVGLPLGMLYGGVSMFATTRLRRLLDRPTLTSHLAAQRTVGVTVLGASGIGLLTSLASGGAFTLWLAPALALLAALLTGSAAWRASQVRRFVRDPSDARYRRVPLSELGVEACAVLPLDEDVSPDAAHALVLVSAARGDGAYRAAGTRVPIALVD